MEDSGLWKACKASRQRMVHFFQPLTTGPRVHQRLRSKTHPGTLNMGSQNDNGEQQYLTMRPSMDHVCMQAPRSCTKWKYWSELLSKWQSFCYAKRHKGSAIVRAGIIRTCVPLKTSPWSLTVRELFGNPNLSFSLFLFQGSADETSGKAFLHRLPADAQNYGWARRASRRSDLSGLGPQTRRSSAMGLAWVDVRRSR